MNLLMGLSDSQIVNLYLYFVVLLFFLFGALYENESYFNLI